MLISSNVCEYVHLVCVCEYVCITWTGQCPWCLRWTGCCGHLVNSLVVSCQVSVEKEWSVTLNFAIKKCTELKRMLFTHKTPRIVVLCKPLLWEAKLTIPQTGFHGMTAWQMRLTTATISAAFPLGHRIIGTAPKKTGNASCMPKGGHIRFCADYP